MARRTDKELLEVFNTFLKEQGAYHAYWSNDGREPLDTRMPDIAKFNEAVIYCGFEWYCDTQNTFDFWKALDDKWQQSTHNIPSEDARAMWRPIFELGLHEYQTASYKAKAPTADGVKHDKGKPEFRLIPQQALEDVAKVMSYGAKKYAPDNWRKVPNGHDRYLDAALRHINAHLRGDVSDDESGLPHLAHAVCSLMMAMESK